MIEFKVKGIMNVIAILQQLKNELIKHHGDNAQILEIKVNKYLFELVKKEVLKTSTNLGIKLIKGE